MQDLDEFQERLFANAKESVCDRSMMTISAACRRCGGQIHEIVALILDGTIENVAAIDNHGFRIDALRVDVDEVVAHIKGSRLATIEESGLDLTTVAQTQRRLKVHPTTVPYLLQKNLLKTVEVRNPRTNFRQNYIVGTSVEEFAQDHVSISDLARAHETHPIKMFEHLTNLGIKPIFEQVGRVARFYRKVDVAEVSFPARR